MEDSIKVEKYDSYLEQRRQISKEYRQKQKAKLNRMTEIETNNEKLIQENNLLLNENELLKKQILDLTKQLINVTSVKVNEVNGFSQRQKLLVDFR